MPLQQLALQALLCSLPAGATPGMQRQQRQEVKAAVCCWGCSSRQHGMRALINKPEDGHLL
jgi:hypothetical protein